MKNYDNLRVLLSSYFHQDWDLAGPTWEDAVAEFVRMEPPDVVQSAAHEIERLLATVSEGAALSAMLASLGCEYSTGDPAGDRQWLEQVRRRLRERPLRNPL